MGQDGERAAALGQALAAAERRYLAANPQSAASFAEACRWMPGGNTRSTVFYGPFPLTIARGEGVRLFDLDGHEYLDFLCEYTAALYGHSHPAIARAIQAALAGGMVLSGPNRYEVELARLICARFPSCEQVRFCNSGTEANLMAIPAARAFTGREAVLAFEGAYHGGVLNFTHGPSAVNVPYPFVFAEYNDLGSASAAAERNAGRLAAILVEPMIGAGGGIAGEPEFLRGLRALATRHNLLLIFDEVMTSRHSAGGMQARLGLTPDLTSFGKYIGGGVTFGGFGGRADIMACYDMRKPDGLAHAGTFNNNVLTMAAGVAGLTEIFTREVAEALFTTGERLKQRLNDIARARGVAAQVTGQGSILNVHFQSRPIRKPADLAETPQEARALFHLEMLARGIYLARRGFISLSLMHGEHELERFAQAFDGFLDEYRTVLP